MRSHAKIKGEKGEEMKYNEMKLLKKLEIYERIYDENTEFFSSYNPDMIEKSLIDHLKD